MSSFTLAIVASCILTITMLTTITRADERGHGDHGDGGQPINGIIDKCSNPENFCFGFKKNETSYGPENVGCLSTRDCNGYILGVHAEMMTEYFEGYGKYELGGGGGSQQVEVTDPPKSEAKQVARFYQTGPSNETFNFCLTAKDDLYLESLEFYFSDSPSHDFPDNYTSGQLTFWVDPAQNETIQALAESKVFGDRCKTSTLPCFRHNAKLIREDGYTQGHFFLLQYEDVPRYVHLVETYIGQPPIHHVTEAPCALFKPKIDDNQCHQRTKDGKDENSSAALQVGVGFVVSLMGLVLVYYL